MDRLVKYRRMWLALGIFSCISAVLGTVALAITALYGIYVAVVILVLVVGHGFYGIPFYFTAYMRTRADIAVFIAYTEGARTTTELSLATGLTEDATRARLRSLASLGII